MPHYENLQLYLRPGLKLKKIHRVVQFNQSQWLKQHIKLSTEKILEAENNGEEDEKALYKLMNNAVYEKNNEKIEK